MKKIITTLLFVFLTVTIQGQINYRLEGNIGRPEITDTLILKEERGEIVDGFIATGVLDTLYIVKGEILPIEGRLSEPMMARAKGKQILLLHIILDNGTTKIDGTIDGSIVRQSGTPLVDAMNQMEEEHQLLMNEFRRVFSSGEPIDTMGLIALEDSFVVSVISAHPSDPIGDRKSVV